MIKVAHVSTNFNPGIVAQDTLALARDQRARGWQAEFVTGSNATPGLIQDRESQGFQVTKISSLLKRPNPFSDLRAMWELARFFQEKKFDVVHTNMPKAGIIGRLAARLAGVKTIIHTVHGPSFPPTLPRPQYWFYKTMERLAGKATDQYIFVSQAMRDSFVQGKVCQVDKTAVVYYGKDFAPFIGAATLSEPERQVRRQAAGFNPDDIILGIVARIVPLKGHDYALQALRELKKEYRNLKYLIVGGAKTPTDQIYTDKLKSLVKTLDLEGEVIFAGWQADTPYYYSIFHIYAMTSMFEGLSIALLEAYAADLPVVGFFWPGAEEVLGDDVRKLVSPKDVPGLVEVLKREIAQVAENQFKRGKDLAKIVKLQERHSFERRVREIGEIYTNLLDVSEKSVLSPSPVKR
jgi:glycosyltransferase involved in cell wall biosynthesis